MQPKQKRKWRRICPLSNLWLALIGGFLLVEFVFLALMAGSLSHLHPTQASARRKILRFFDPRYRRKTKHHIDKSELDVRPFHHSHLAIRRDYFKHKVFLQRNFSNATLDDFYTRSHIPASSQQVPFLVVGGSDGSGTRTFVQALMDLGVTMIVDSYDTMDVNGEEMPLVNDTFHTKKLCGWPALASMILWQTRSANYTVQSLSQKTQQLAMEALLQLKSSLVQKGKKQAKKNQEPGHHAPAAGVQYGWKAPISMVLLPVLQQVFGPIKFIHVVRDGRDVALSDNQSPVQKFYKIFYGPTASPPDFNMSSIPISSWKKHQAIQLWNDWNSQAWQWARQRANELDENDMQSFDYLVMRTEDLIDPATRMEALVQLAEFVGARVSPDELCCLSKKGIHDLGRSGHRRGGPPEMILEGLRGTVPGEDQKVKARYGKWKQKLQDKPELLGQLQHIGGDALRLFGYEPSQQFLDRSEDVQAFPCDEKIVCPH